ncbi:hypothetical protein F4808DRAFT_415264 [Astrocystis sublimbata]|nr:hypothetical protein F4808DRAFT_415264 [Astrocystis sublimbata]
MSHTRARRQNHSCDQCRRSKKACDGYWINNGGGSGIILGMTLGSDPQYDILPCSYCVKTKKRCTLNMYWAARGERSPASTFTDPRVEGSRRLDNDEFHSHDNFMSIGPSNALSLLQTPHHRSVDWAAPLPTPGAAVSADSPLRPWDAGSSLNFDLHSGTYSSTNDNPHAPAEYLPQVEELATSQPWLDSASQATDFDHLTEISGISKSHSMPDDFSGSMRSSDRRRNALRRNFRIRRRSENWTERLPTPMSPEYIGPGPLASFNNHLVTESLLQIYSNVLENNLSCWLADEICPYKMKSRKGQSHTHLDAPIPTGQDSPPSREWDLVQSDSIYRRVKQLDRVAQSSRLIQLTDTQNRAASRALNLVVMAFAAQWAQGRRRRDKMCSTTIDTLDPTHTGDLIDDFADEFEQDFQLSLWEQAKKALQDVAGLESYRVVYAELVFGLVQRPWDNSEHQKATLPSVSGFNNLTESSSSSSWLSVLETMLSEDGPPVYTERAGRKMQALKFRFEANETGSCKAPFTRQGNTVATLTSDERSTIGRLYWLAVMFDTVSSSMNERPVVLTDEDCQHDDIYSSDVTEDSINLRWNLKLFAQDDPKSPSSLSWPCPYESAVTAINRSAAVKVLLFRYVSYLQNALRKRYQGHKIDDLIQSTMQIYRYWNVTHGAFFRSLIQNYDSIPVRLKSWFPCIHIPWHLGALMLADLIEYVDDNGLGTEEASRNRLSVGLATKVRKSSAVELAELARVTTPDEVNNMPTEQLPGFHFAVNEGSILTEPWTVLLIRAFTRASVFHLGVAEDLRRQEWDILGQESEEYRDSLRRCNTCIKALWFLGRKSEMARSLSKVLAEVLRRQEAEHAQT